MFSAAGAEVPCVGVSIGIERVFAIKEAQAAAQEGGRRVNAPDVYVASIGEGMIEERMGICSLLWAKNISTEFSTKEDAKLKSQLGAAAKAGIRFMIYFGSDEMEAGQVKVKDLDARTEESVARSDVVAYVMTKLGRE